MTARWFGVRASRDVGSAFPLGQAPHNLAYLAELTLAHTALTFRRTRSHNETRLTLTLELRPYLPARPKYAGAHLRKELVILDGVSSNLPAGKGRGQTGQVTSRLIYASSSGVRTTI